MTNDKWNALLRKTIGVIVCLMLRKCCASENKKMAIEWDECYPPNLNTLALECSQRPISFRREELFRLNINQANKQTNIAKAIYTNKLKLHVRNRRMEFNKNKNFEQMANQPKNDENNTGEKKITQLHSTETS